MHTTFVHVLVFGCGEYAPGIHLLADFSDGLSIGVAGEYRENDRRCQRVDFIISDSEYYKAITRKNGVKVISATEAISNGAEGILLESMLEGLAEYYRLMHYAWILAFYESEKAKKNLPNGSVNRNWKRVA